MSIGSSKIRHRIHNTSFSLYLTNETNKLGVLHNTGLERLATDKQSSLRGQFVRYEENEGCEYGPGDYNI